MRLSTGKRTAGWLMALAVGLTLVIAAGAFQKIQADSDETYEGLKLFSDVLDQIERNYVEPVDARELILKAIDGILPSPLGCAIAAQIRMITKTPIPAQTRMVRDRHRSTVESHSLSAPHSSAST